MKRDIIIIEDNTISVNGNEIWMTATEIAGLFRLFAKTYKEGYKKGKLTPKYTHYANI